jgi:hypothetical protein
MAIRRRLARHSHDAKGRKQHVEELSGRLAPLEEQVALTQTGQQGDGHGNDGTIRVDSSSVKVHNHFTEGERDTAGIFYLEPVVVAILVAMLIFIAFIAWQITLMPPLPPK